MIKCILMIGMMMLLINPFHGSGETVEVETTETEQSEETATEEAETVKELDNSINDNAQKIVNNVTGGLGDFWEESKEKTSGGVNPEEKFGYKAMMSISIFCRRTFFIGAPLAILLGLFIRGIAGLNTPMKRIGTFVMIGVPIVLGIFAYMIPIGASIFYY